MGQNGRGEGYTHTRTRTHTRAMHRAEGQLHYLLYASV